MTKEWAMRQRGKVSRVWAVFCATCDAHYLWPSPGCGAEASAVSVGWNEGSLGWLCAALEEESL